MVATLPTDPGRRPTWDERLLRFLTPQNLLSLPRVLRYGLAAAIVVAAVALNGALLPLMGTTDPYNIALLAIFVTTLLLGIGPGLLSVVLNDLAVEVFIMGSLPNLLGKETLVRLGTSMAVGVFICCAFHAARVAQAKARRSEARLAALSAAAFEGIMESEAGRIVDCNDQFAQMVGCAVEDLKGVPIIDLVAPEDRERAIANIRENRESVIEHAMLRKDGTRLIVEAHGRPMLPGSPRRHTAVRDITARKQMEAALQLMAKKYSTMFDATSDGVWIHNLGGRIVEANNAYCRMSGYSRNELTGMPVSQLEAKESPGEIAAHILKLLESGGHDRFESRHRRKDGSVFDVDITALYLQIEGGRIAIFVRDITDRKLAEEALRLSAEKFSKAFATNPAAIVLTGLEDGLIMDVNDTWQAMFGYRRDEVIGRYSLSLNVWPTPEARSSFVRELRNKGSLRNREMTLRRNSGESFVALASAETLVLDSRKIILSTWLDISDRKRAEERLAADLSALTRMHTLSTRILESQDAESLLQEIMDAAVAISDADRGTLQLLEGETLRIVAHRGHQQTFLEFFASAENVASVCGLALKRGERVVIPDVEISPLFVGTSSLQALRVAGVRAVQSTPLMTRGGKLLGILTTHWSAPRVPDEQVLWRLDLLARQAADLIERRQSEESLRRLNATLGQRVAAQTVEIRRGLDATKAERQRLFDVLETLPPMICLLTPDYHVTFANRSFRERFGEANGRHCYEYCYGRSSPCEFCESYKVLETGQPHHWEVHVPDGTVIEAHDFPFTDADGSSLILEMDLDVTESRRAESELRSTHESLATRAGQLRALAGELTLTEQRERRRLARILHDHLQQLLVGAKFRTVILGRAGDDVVRQGAQEVEELLDECIAASRSLTAELSPPILHEAGLNAGLEWLARWMADKHGLFVELSMESDTAQLAEDVRVLLFESVRELLFNAVKHSHARSAAVNVRPVDGRVQVVVSDQGAGFDPEAIPQAGEEGGGFGLFSIRERLELIGGRLEIESAVGQGSRFVLTAPPSLPTVVEGESLAEAEPPRSELEAHATPALHGAKIRVLLADDHAVMREGLNRLLVQEPDIEVIGEAADGFQAVELAASLSPDVILMDMSMPKLNGVEATRAIHSDHPDIRIIGLSMFEESERAQALREAGAVDYVTKSGPSSNLIAAIRACMTARWARGLSQLPPAKPEA